MTIEELAREILPRLTAAHLPDAETDAREIARVALEQDKIDAHARAEELAASRAQGTPLALITGRRTFMGVELETAPGALVPREETELLARTALGLLAAKPGDRLRVVDMCCGSGNLACAIAWHEPRARVWAADLTDPCVRLAERNVARLGLSDRATVHQGDLFGAFDGLSLAGRIDLIVCNPPYISSSKLAGDSAPLLDHEPREAFDGGPYGLSIHQRVITAAAAFLEPGGWLCFEIGLGQERQIKILFDRSRLYADFRFEHDVNGNPRVAMGRFSGGV